MYLGTTWQKIEGRFLLGTSGSGSSKQTGGSMSKTISQANLPNVKISLNSFSLTRGNMEITGAFDGLNNEYGYANGAFYKEGGSANSGSGADDAAVHFQASRTWTGTTNTAAPQTLNLGNGQALDIRPSYYTTHIWLRTS